MVRVATYFGDGEGGGPGILEDIEADASLMRRNERAERNEDQRIGLQQADWLTNAGHRIAGHRTTGARAASEAKGKKTLVCLFWS